MAAEATHVEPPPPRDVPLLVAQPAVRRRCCRLRSLRMVARCFDCCVFGCLRVLHISVPEAAPQAVIRKFWLPVAGFITSITVGVGLQVFSDVRGWQLLLLGVPDECVQLQHWLLGYCLALTMIPFCWAISGPLVFWWAANGRSVRDSVAEQELCREQVPGLWYFVDEVVYTTIATVVFLVVGILFLLVTKRMHSRLRARYGSEGAAVAECIRVIQAQARPQIEEGQECSICLETDGESAHSDWLGLQCSHVFHEACLLEWLRRDRRCPLCRLDLQRAYLDPQDQAGPTSDSGIEFEGHAIEGNPENRNLATETALAEGSLVAPAAAAPGST